MIIDNHVHVGWFSDGYHSPKEVWYITQSAGIDEIVVSSTTTCAYKCLYKLILREMRELKKLGGSAIHPILWVRPDFLNGRCRYAISQFLRGLKWEGVKIHYEAHPEWMFRSDLVEKAILLAERLNVPFLIHTGVGKTSAGCFEKFIKRHPNCIFILAHGSPPQEAICLLKKYSNCYVDTACMLKSSMEQFVQAGVGCQLLFGTDMPICSHEIGIDAEIRYIQHKREELASLVDMETFKHIMNRCPYKRDVRN